MTNPLNKPALVLLGSLCINACSGGGADTTVRNDPGPPTANHPPSISGSPATTVIRDQGYAFIPTAGDPDGDTLTFSIVNKPAWADFDPATGALTGTPSDAHVGTTTNIVITASDGELSSALDAFDIEVLQVFLGSARLSWDIPSTNADGSPLDDLAGFEVHYGMESGNYSDIVTVSDPMTGSAQIERLAEGTWYFSVRAFDNAGNRSDFSDEVSKAVRP